MENQVSAILLAAGSSTRMGEPKQLLPIGTKTAIIRCLDTALAAGIGDIIVVLGTPHGCRIGKSIAGYCVTTVYNNRPESEMAGSVMIGLRSARNSSTGIMVCPVDHPLASADTLRALIRLHSEKPLQIVIPSFHHRRGHPTLFPKELLTGLLPGKNLRDVIKENSERVRYYPTSDEGVILDMDTPADYRKIIERDS